MATTITQPRNPLLDITQILQGGLPLLFGEKGNEKTSFDPLDLSQSQALANSLFQRGTSTAHTDKVVEDILYRAQLAFAPILGEERAAGLYNSQTRLMLGREATARAVAAASSAVLEDQQKSLAQATAIQNQNTAARAQTTNRNTQKTKSGQGKNLLTSLAVAYGGRKVMQGADKVTEAALDEIDNLGLDAQASAESNVPLEFFGGQDAQQAEAFTETFSGVAPEADLFSGFDSAALAADSADLAAGADFGAFDPGGDFGAAADVAAGFSDFENLPLEEFDFSGLGDAFGGFFAEGGLVGRDGRAGYSPAALTARANLRPARPNIAQPASASSAKSTTAQQQQQARKRVTASAGAPSDPTSGDSGPEATAAASPEASKAMADLGISPAAAGFAMMSLAMGAPVAFAAETLAKNVAINKAPGLIADLFGPPTTLETRIASFDEEVGFETEAAMANANITQQPDATAPLGVPDTIVDALVSNIVTDNPFGIDEGTGYKGENPNPAEGAVPSGNVDVGTGDFGSFDPGGSFGGGESGGPSSGGAAGDGNSRSDAGGGGEAGVGGVGDAGSDSGGSDSSSDSGGPGGDGSGDGSGNGYEEGGIVTGSNRMDALNIDGIPIVVQPDEYVIPEDVVEILGPDFFDKILAAFHTPGSGRQRRAR